MRNLGLILEYDGAAFSGWQLQPGRRTVHDEVRRALQRLTGSAEPPVVHCSGRTDAGVHAMFQVGNVELETDLPLDALRGGVNHHLPRDIALLGIAEMPAEFHARRSALSKTYCYRILNRRQRTALDRGRVWHVVAPLDLEAMIEAATALAGRHDFASFQATNTEVEETVRTIFRVGWQAVGDELHFRIAGEGFLKYMVRNIVGTLVEVGLGKRSAAEMAAVIQACDRRRAGQTAPPDGLYLERVYYAGPHEALLREGLRFRGRSTWLDERPDFHRPGAEGGRRTPDRDQA